MKKTQTEQGVGQLDEVVPLTAKSPDVAKKCDPSYDLFSVKKARGFDYEAGRRFLDSHGIEDPFLYIADDFDDPLPEDFLLRPLP